MSNDTNKHGAHVSRATPPDRWSHRRAEKLNEAVHVALSVHAPALSRRKRDAVSSHVRQQMIDSYTSCNEPNSAPNRLTDPAQGFQGDVAEWMAKCFLASLYSDMTERGDRLLEEVLELLQAHGYDSARVPTLVNYVFGRPVGEPAQEVGGVMVTLAAYCSVAGLSMQADGQAELDRINQPEVMARIRAKQEAKNALRFDTPLPGIARQPVGQPITVEAVAEIFNHPKYGLSVHWLLENGIGELQVGDVLMVSDHAITDEDGSGEVYAALPAQAVDLPYSLDADPSGIRAMVAGVISDVMTFGAQGHTRPPAGHWAEPFWNAARANATAQAVDLDCARDEGHDGAIRYVLGYLNGVGDWGSTQYVELLNACGRERIIRSAVEGGELDFTGLGRWVAERGTDEERTMIDSQAVRNG